MAKDASPAPKFRRLKADDRRQALIRATLHCLSLYGPQGTGVREICRHVDVSPGLLRHYFEGKDDLILAAFRTVTTDFHSEMEKVLEDGAKSSEERLKACFGHYFSRQVTEQDTVGAYLAFWTMARSDPEVHRIQRSAYKDLRSLLEPVLAALAEERGATVDQRQVAIGLIALLDGLWLEMCLDPKAFSRSRAVAMSWSWLDAVVGHDGPAAGAAPAE